jgi:hypothetical protein
MVRTLAIPVTAALLCAACETKVGTPKPVVTVTIHPGTAGVLPGGAQAFTATVAGTGDGRVSWSVAEGSAGGVIDPSGLFTGASASGTVHVVATSVADPSARAVASVVVGAVYGLPADRITPWRPGVTYNGGLPHRTSTCRTLSPLGADQDDTGQLQRAIDECPDDSVVQLTAGTFELGGSGYTYADAHLRIVRSNVTLRGTVDADGRPATLLRTPCTYAEGEAIRCNTAIVVGTLWLHPDPTSSVSLAADVGPGATQLTVASNPGYQVGELVIVDEETDPDLTWWNPERCPPSSPGGCRTWFIRPNRPVGQVNEVAAVSGNVVTFSAPFHIPFRRARSAQVTRYLQANGRLPTTRVGVEDLKVSGGGGGDGGGNVHFFGPSYSWARNVEADRSQGTSVNFDGSFRCELRDSYVHSTVDPNPGGAGYGVGFNFYAADNLVENTAVWNFNKVMVMRASGGGNVVGYSYFEDGWISYAPCFVESGLNASHYATAHMELFEGNLAFNFASDTTWGNSVFITVFRNHLTGQRRAVPPLDRYAYDVRSNGVHQRWLYYEDQGARRAAMVGAYHWWSAFAGNVLGYDGQQPLPHPRSEGQGGYASLVYEASPDRWDVAPMWDVAWTAEGVQEPKTLATLIRHGNYDFVTRSQRWDPSNAIHALPASLYLPSAPEFMQGLTWPWVDPATGATYTLPAKARFDAIHAGP